MTIVELGYEYLRQAEELWAKIQRIEELISQDQSPFGDYVETEKKMQILYDMHAETVTTGNHLVHYYDK